MILLELPFTKPKPKPSSGGPAPAALPSFGILGDDFESLGLGVILAKAKKNIFVYNSQSGLDNAVVAMAQNSEVDSVKNKFSQGCLECQLDYKVNISDLVNIKPKNDFADFSLVNNIILSGTKLQEVDYVDKTNQILARNQAFFILDAPLLAGFELANIRQKADFQEYCPIIEISPLFNHLKISQESVSLFGLKGLSYIAGVSKNMTRKGIDLLNPYPSKLMPASNCLERAFVNMAGIIRPILLLYLLNLPKSRQEIAGDFYAHPEILKLAYDLEIELKLILKTYSCSLNALNSKVCEDSPSHVSYNKSLEASFKANLIKSALHGMLVKSNINVKRAFETIIEDIKLNLVLINQLAELASVQLTIIPKAINEVSKLSRCDLTGKARTLNDIGFDRLHYKEIIEVLNQ